MRPRPSRQVRQPRRHLQVAQQVEHDNRRVHSLSSMRTSIHCQAEKQHANLSPFIRNMNPTKPRLKSRSGPYHNSGGGRTDRSENNNRTRARGTEITTGMAPADGWTTFPAKELGYQKLNQIFIRADARTLVNLVPQLLLCDGVLGCPTLGVTAALAVAAAEIRACARVARRFRCGRTPCRLSRR